MSIKYAIIQFLSAMLGRPQQNVIFDKEMTNAQFTYHKGKLTKWLLAATLFFSIFTFSGYDGNYQSRYQQTTLTELVISNNHEACKRIISFEKAFGLITYIDFLTSPYKNWTNTLFTYNILTKVKINSLSRQFYSHKSADCSLQVKTIPQSSDEDIL
jgi:hypothetical protein